MIVTMKIREEEMYNVSSHKNTIYHKSNILVLSNSFDITARVIITNITSIRNDNLVYKFFLMRISNNYVYKTMNDYIQKFSKIIVI